MFYDFAESMPGTLCGDGLKLRQAARDEDGAGVSVPRTKTFGLYSRDVSEVDIITNDQNIK